MTAIGTKKRARQMGLLAESDLRSAHRVPVAGAVPVEVKGERFWRPADLEPTEARKGRQLKPGAFPVYRYACGKFKWVEYRASYILPEEPKP